MKHFILFCSAFCLLALKTYAGNDTISLPQGLTNEEKTRLHEIGENFHSTPPPEGQVNNIAEFEPMQGVLIRYPLGIPLSLIADLSQDVIVYTIVGSINIQNLALSDYQNAGVNTDNCQFIIAPSDSYWTRDYGPWFIAEEDQKISIVDFIYNRPRPNDDNIPEQVASFLDLDVYGMNLVHTGGNYMTDGYGISASTDLVLEENNFNQQFIDQTMSSYLGISTYHITTDPQDTYLKHIDTWAKFLDTDKILIAEVGSYSADYADLENMAQYFSQQISAYGTPYKVFRVYTTTGQPYTNSLIVNKKIYVPVVGSAWDAVAIQTYQDAMPGYEIVGVEGSWLSTDALHCRVKGIADTGMLRISHIPLSGIYPWQPGYEIQAEIMAFSSETLYNDSLFIIYSANNGAYDTVPLINLSGKIYTGSIPVQATDTVISYYLSASDASGRKALFPYAAPHDTRSFRILPSTIVNARVLLEGGYTSQGMMGVDLNQLELIPSQQPFDIPPWNYQGTEQVDEIPGEAVDWVLLSLRRAPDAWLATTETTVERMAAFVLSDGQIVNTEGSPLLSFSSISENNLFLVIQHRNHISIMTSSPLANNKEVINLDFTISSSSAYSPSEISALKQTGDGFFVMFGGDADANGQVQVQDINDAWVLQSGTSGYISADFDMDGEVQMQDKNNIWVENSGVGSFTP